jgi:hypothetical protein
LRRMHLPPTFAKNAKVGHPPRWGHRMGFMVKVEDDWKANVKVYTDDAAIRWKASQPKDCEKIRSENSEDGLTWQVFRTFAATGHLDDWVKDALGIVDNFVPYYWQRLHDSGKIDADIAAALREIEPYHEKNRRQHTETDLILRGKRHLVVCDETGLQNPPHNGMAAGKEKSNRG